MGDGLFRYSRHPNFFCEQMIWWTVFMFTLPLEDVRMQLPWSCGGAVLLTSLFHSSTNLTEEISLKKYPQYKDYQHSVSRLIPMAPHNWPSLKLLMEWPNKPKMSKRE